MGVTQYPVPMRRVSLDRLVVSSCRLGVTLMENSGEVGWPDSACCEKAMTTCEVLEVPPRWACEVHLSEVVMSGRGGRGKIGRGWTGLECLVEKLQNRVREGSSAGSSSGSSRSRRVARRRTQESRVMNRAGQSPGGRKAHQPEAGGKTSPGTVGTVQYEHRCPVHKVQEWGLGTRRTCGRVSVSTTVTARCLADRND